MSLWVTEMKVAMARLEPNKPTVMPMVTGDIVVRTATIFVGVSLNLPWTILSPELSQLVTEPAGS